jgi:hypothetical protein
MAAYAKTFTNNVAESLNSRLKSHLPDGQLGLIGTLKELHDHAYALLAHPMIGRVFHVASGWETHQAYAEWARMNVAVLCAVDGRVQVAQFEGNPDNLQTAAFGAFTGK